VIQVTLTFDSIDKAVAALRSLPEVDIQHASVAKAPAPKEKPASPPPAADKPQAASSAATPAADSASAKPKDDAPSQPAADEPLAYEVLQKAVFKLAAVSREAAGAVNAQFGVKSMKDLPEGKRRAALAAVQEKLAELEVPA